MMPVNIFSSLRKGYRELKKAPRGFQLPLGAESRAYVKPFYQSSSQATSKRLRDSVWTTACIQAYCRSLPNLSFVVEKWDPKEKTYKRQPGHPAEELLRRPNGYQNPRLFLSSIITSLIKDGNALISIKESRSLKRVTKLEVLHPDGVTPVLDRVDMVEGYKVSRIGWWGDMFEKGSSKDFMFVKRKDMIHIQFVNPEDFAWGISPLECAKDVQDGETMAMNYNKSIMYNSGRPSFALTTEDKLSALQRKQIREALIEDVSRENSGLPLVLMNGLKPVSLGKSPVELDYYKSSLLDCYRVCSILGVPPAVIGITEDATQNNVREYKRAFYTDAVIPMFEMICEAFTHAWVHSRLGKEYRIWYDTSRVSELREDIKDKIAMLPVLADKGFSVNEICRVLHLNMPETEAGNIRQYSGHIIDRAGFSFDLPVRAGGDGYNKPANGSQIGEGETEVSPRIGIRDDAEGDPETGAPDSPVARAKPYGRRSRKDSAEEQEIMRLWNSLEADRKIYSEIFYPQAKDRLESDMRSFAGYASKPVEDRAAFEAVFRESAEPAWKSFLTRVWRDSANMALESFSERFENLKARDTKSLSEAEESEIESIVETQARIIVDTTTHWIISYVHSGLAKGKSEEELTAELMERVPELSEFRAAVIAENEVLSAINYGNHIGAIRSGTYTEKVWRTQRDDRVRPTHIIMEGQTKLLSEPYSNGLRYPGDPVGPANEIINCRCFETYA